MAFQISTIFFIFVIILVCVRKVNEKNKCEPFVFDEKAIKGYRYLELYTLIQINSLNNTISKCLFTVCDVFCSIKDDANKLKNDYLSVTDKINNELKECDEAYDEYLVIINQLFVLLGDDDTYDELHKELENIDYSIRYLFENIRHFTNEYIKHTLNGNISRMNAYINRMSKEVKNALEFGSFISEVRDEINLRTNGKKPNDLFNSFDKEKLYELIDVLLEIYEYTQYLRNTFLSMTRDFKEILLGNALDITHVNYEMTMVSIDSQFQRYCKNKTEFFRISNDMGLVKEEYQKMFESLNSIGYFSLKIKALYELQKEYLKDLDDKTLNEMKNLMETIKQANDKIDYMYIFGFIICGGQRDVQ